MKKSFFITNEVKKVVFLLITMITFSNDNLFGQKQPLSLTDWTYIEVDSTRQKWGDWNEPEWLRYFGLDMSDINHDGYLDIVSGRYVYKNPGSNMEDKWKRIDLGLNVDGMLFVNVDNDEHTDIIAEALPNVYWLEADNLEGSAWSATIIGHIPKTAHNNGQGYATGDIIKGGKPEILLTADDGIYYCEIPDNPVSSSWNFNRLVKTGSDEGIFIADINADSFMDVAYGDIEEGKHENPTLLYWLKNPGQRGEWEKYLAGETNHAIDRIKMADINKDGKTDIIVSEERYPGEEPDAELLWFEQPEDPEKEWKQHQIITQYSMNNLDVGDLDHDGDIDLVTNEHKGPHLRVQVFENEGKGKFTVHQIDKGKESHLGSQLVDLDNDGDLDMVSIAWDHYKYLHVWRNDAIKENNTWMGP